MQVESKNVRHSRMRLQGGRPRHDRWVNVVTVREHLYRIGNHAVRMVLGPYKRPLTSAELTKNAEAVVKGYHEWKRRTMEPMDRPDPDAPPVVVTFEKATSEAKSE